MGHAPGMRTTSRLTAALLRLAAVSLLFSGGASPARAALLPIANAGFEDLYLGSNLPAEYGGDVPTGTFPTGPPPSGWTAWSELGTPPPGSFIGVINPGTAADFAPNPPFFDSGAPEGDNAVLLYTSGDSGGPEYGVEQTLAAVLTAGMTYTLSAEVGNIGSGTALLPPYSTLGFFDIDGFPGYRIQLVAGTTVVAEAVDLVLPLEREWLRSSVVLVVDEDHANLGETLSVRVVNRNQPDVMGVTGIEVDFDDIQLDVSPTPALPLGPAVAWGAAAALALLGAREARRA